jgi:hypothetical protein
MGYGPIELDGGKLPKDADEQSLRTAAQQVVHDEGYELDAAGLVIQR